MIEIGSRARNLPAPPRVVWLSLVDPRRAGTSARGWSWLDDEVEPRVLVRRRARAGRLVVAVAEPAGRRGALRAHPRGRAARPCRFTLLTPHEMPDASKTGHLRKRLNHLLYADLRYSYGN